MKLNLRDPERLKHYSFLALMAEAFFIPLMREAAFVSAFAGIVFLLLRARYEPDFHFRRTCLDWPIAVFVLFGALSVTASPNPFFSAYNFCFLVGLYVSGYVLAVQTIESEAQLKKLVLALAASALLVVLYGYWQIIFGIDTSDMKWVDGDAFPELKKRIFSTLENPNILAGYLAEVVCFLLGFVLSEEEGKRRSLLLVGILLTVGCLAMTYARGACMSLIAVVAGYGLLKNRKVFFGCIAFGVIVLLLSPSLSERLLSVFVRLDTSSEMRLALWESTIAMIEDHPFLGIGWGAYFMVYHSYDFYINNPSVLIVHAHNVYLNYAAEIGVIGAAAYFTFFFGSLYCALKATALKQNVFRAGFRLGAGLAIASVALGGMTDDVLFNIPTSMLFWLVCGMLQRCRELP